MITFQEVNYIREILLPQLEQDLEAAEINTRAAAETGDLRENAAFESAKNSRDALLLQVNHYNRLLTHEIFEARSMRIQPGVQVRITAVAPETFERYRFKSPGGDILHKDDDTELHDVFVVSLALDMPTQGFILKSSPIISQVLDKPSGEYVISLADRAQRRYKYEVLGTK